MPAKRNYCTRNMQFISLNVQRLTFAQKYKCLGTLITRSNADDDNMRRQRTVLLTATELLRIFTLVPLLSNVTYSRHFVVIFIALIYGVILRLIH